MISTKTGDRLARTAAAARVTRWLLATALVLAGVLEQTHAASRNFLWKVSNGQGIVYLVGSVHMLTQDYYPLSPVLDAAFKESDLLVEEADLGELLSADSQFKMLTRGMLPENQSLEKVVSKSTFAEVNKRLSALGLPIEPLQRFKPWMLALTLEGLEWQRAGFDAELGLDKHFYDRANADGKPVRGSKPPTTRFHGSTA